MPNIETLSKIKGQIVLGRLSKRHSLQDRIRLWKTRAFSHHVHQLDGCVLRDVTHLHRSSIDAEKGAREDDEDWSTVWEVEFSGNLGGGPATSLCLYINGEGHGWKGRNNWPDVLSLMWATKLVKHWMSRHPLPPMLRSSKRSQQHNIFSIIRDAHQETAQEIVENNTQRLMGGTTFNASVVVLDKSEDEVTMYHCDVGDSFAALVWGDRILWKSNEFSWNSEHGHNKLSQIEKCLGTLVQKVKNPTTGKFVSTLCIGPSPGVMPYEQQNRQRPSFESIYGENYSFAETTGIETSNQSPYGLTDDKKRALALMMSEPDVGIAYHGSPEGLAPMKLVWLSDGPASKLPFGEDSLKQCALGLCGENLDLKELVRQGLFWKYITEYRPGQFDLIDKEIPKDFPCPLLSGDETRVEQWNRWISETSLYEIYTTLHTQFLRFVPDKLWKDEIEQTLPILMKQVELNDLSQKERTKVLKKLVILGGGDDSIGSLVVDMSWVTQWRN